MTGRGERLKESGWGRCGCKDMGAEMMKGAGVLKDLPLCYTLPIR